MVPRSLMMMVATNNRGTVSPDSIKSILKVEPPMPLWARAGAYRVLFLIATATLVADQLSKYWVRLRIPFGAYLPPDAIEVVPGFLNLIHVGNTGAAWSILTGRSVLLASIALITLLAIFVWRKALGLRDRMIQVAFGLLCGGILGNLVDRIWHKHVIDFVDMHFGSYVYPTFNVADSGICIGVAIYLWYSLRAPKS